MSNQAAPVNMYFISGVGADRRIFRNLTIPEGFAATHLDWIKPERDESMQSYARRLSQSIDPDQPFILVGLSFGGMLANEIARLHPPLLIILISSIPSARELPPYYKAAGRLHLHQLVPIGLLKSMSILKRLFTAETKEEKKFLREAIRSADPGFIRWSLAAIVNWKNEEKPSKYIHIHGSQDLILPVKYTGCTHLIRGGGHLMILTRAKEISDVIAEAVR